MQRQAGGGCWKEALIFLVCNPLEGSVHPDNLCDAARVGERRCNPVGVLARAAFTLLGANTWSQRVGLSW